MRKPLHHPVIAFLWIAACFCWNWPPAICQATQTIPTIEATSLAGQTVRLPHDLATQSVLIVGFSEKSSQDAAECEQKLNESLPRQSGVVVFQVPVLEGAPRLIRGFITQSMKKSVPKTLQPTFVPVFNRESDWKLAAGFDKPDDAYLIITDHAGEVLWRTHGKCTAEKTQSVVTELVSLKQSAHGKQ